MAAEAAAERPQGRQGPQARASGAIPSAAARAAAAPPAGVCAPRLARL